MQQFLVGLCVIRENNDTDHVHNDDNEKADRRDDFHIQVPSVHAFSKFWLWLFFLSLCDRSVS
jgi:hypothetical protein